MNSTKEKLGEKVYECVWLHETMKHVEWKLQRVRDLRSAEDVVDALLADVIRDLREGRENAVKRAAEHTAYMRSASDDDDCEEASP